MLLQCSGITKSYGTETILSNIHLQIEHQDRIGLVGVNGAGKSTLLKIIAGTITPDRGHIYKSKSLRIGYLAQDSGLNVQGSIMEALRSVYAHLLEAEQELRTMEQEMSSEEIIQDERKYKELMQRYAERSDAFREQGGYEMDANIRSVLHGMGFGNVDPSTPVHTLSGGQKTRLALAKLLLQAPDLLMLDEPTNHLDIPTLTWLEQYLRAYKGALLIVSHDRYFLDATVQTIIEIERHQATRYTGNYSQFIERKAHEYEVKLKAYEKQQETIARMEDFIQRNLARASTSKRAQSRRKALEKMERLERPVGDLKHAKFSFQIERPSGNDVLKAEGLSMSYSSKNKLFYDLNFQLKRGQSVALIGPNGVGKSTLLKILIGQYQPDQGTIRWGTNVKIGYYDQEQTNLNEDNTILDEVWNAFPHMEEVRIRSVLGNFLFSGDDVTKKISSLSGGEKARVSLAKLMLLDANVLILDEPTNHLDIYSKETLESALLDYEGTILFISHDRYFLNKMAESILELSPNGLEYFLGNYDEYAEKKQELSEFAALNREEQQDQKLEKAEDRRKTTSYEALKQAKREERARKRQIQQLETEIMDVEETMQKLEQALADPDIFHDYEAVQEQTDKLDVARKKHAELYAQWESLLSE